MIESGINFIYDKYNFTDRKRANEQDSRQIEPRVGNRLLNPKATEKCVTFPK